MATTNREIANCIIQGVNESTDPADNTPKLEGVDNLLTVLEQIDKGEEVIGDLDKRALRAARFFIKSMLSEDAAIVGKSNAEIAFRALSNFVNSYSRGAKEFADCLDKEHRTLQQSMMGVFAACIRKWAEMKYYDLRNEDTVKFCKKLVEQFGDEMYFRYI